METNTHSYPEDAKIPIGEAARLIGVSVTTLRRWEREGKVSSSRTLGNQRRYSIEDVAALASGEQPTPKHEVAS